MNSQAAEAAQARAAAKRLKFAKERKQKILDKIKAEEETFKRVNYLGSCRNYNRTLSRHRPASASQIVLSNEARRRKIESERQIRLKEKLEYEEERFRLIKSNKDQRHYKRTLSRHTPHYVASDPIVNHDEHQREVELAVRSPNRSYSELPLQIHSPKRQNPFVFDQPADQLAIEINLKSEQQYQEQEQNMKQVDSQDYLDDAYALNQSLDDLNNQHYSFDDDYDDDHVFDEEQNLVYSSSVSSLPSHMSMRPRTSHSDYRHKTNRPYTQASKSSTSSASSLPIRFPSRPQTAHSGHIPHRHLPEQVAIELHFQENDNFLQKQAQLDQSQAEQQQLVKQRLEALSTARAQSALRATSKAARVAERRSQLDAERLEQKKAKLQQKLINLEAQKEHAKSQKVAFIRTHRDARTMRMARKEANTQHIQQEHWEHEVSRRQLERKRNEELRLQQEQKDLIKQTMIQRKKDTQARAAFRRTHRENERRQKLMRKLKKGEAISQRKFSAKKQQSEHQARLRATPNYVPEPVIKEKRYFISCVGANTVVDSFSGTKLVYPDYSSHTAIARAKKAYTAKTAPVAKIAFRPQTAPVKRATRKKGR